jgi:alkanesulfonate monooxygenase SsuD/methylene tetrahydromethanopterin reductase-like flavin-dependent oxidoreductase (luciferase family)
MAQRGIFVAPFGELADPALLAGLAARAEAKGWDGFFLWDHIRYSPPELPVLDPWIALSAIAVATERVRIGPMVTPVSRRRPHKLARETATLDLLSKGRLILGVGLGSDNHGEFEDFEDVVEPKERARLLDDGLDALTRHWEEFRPRPVQTPRIPVWVAARYPKRRPLERARRWDGLFPIDLPGPQAVEELWAELPRDRPYDFVIQHDAGEDTAPWVEAGATWTVVKFGKEPTEQEVREAIDG